GGTDAQWAENLSLLFTFRGIPCIYYGSEIGFRRGKVIDKGPNGPLSNTGRAYFGGYITGDVEASTQLLAMSMQLSTTILLSTLSVLTRFVRLFLHCVRVSGPSMDVQLMAVLLSSVHIRTATLS
uniref:hypothetical protein n=1 Tax=Prevotella sp. TaxID=59823 RepID=UPI0025D71C6D